MCEQIKKLSEWRSAAATLLFAPLPDEPDVLPLFDAVNFALVPRIAETLEVVPVPGPPPCEGWRRGKYGIWEGTGRAMSTATIAFALVPGVAFTRNGDRLGRGKGYYDRFLKTLPPTCFTCGVCFDCQLVDSLPIEPHDVPLDAVVTPSGVWRRTAVDARE